MDWSKINPHKTKIIVASFALAFVVGIVSLLNGVKQVRDEDIARQPLPSQNAPVEVDLKIKGNKQSRIYHLQGCPNYNDITERNIIWFKTEEEAEGRRFRKAKNC